MKTIKHAQAKKNGIVFYSNKSPQTACITWYNENGEIESEVAHFMTYDSLCDAPHTFHLKKWIKVLFCIILIGIPIFILQDPYFIATSCLLCTISPSLFKLFEISISFNLSIKRFHAVEHMAINSYKKLQRIPNLEEIKNASRFSKFCGSMIHIVFSIGSSILYIVIGIFSRYDYYIHIPIFIITFFLIFNKRVNGWLKYFQFLFTAKPTDKELELGIVALQNFEKMENSICQESKNGCCTVTII